MSEIILESEVGVDYTHLENLLAAGAWKEADEETYYLIRKVTNCENEAYFFSERWLEFPCKDFRTIDQLWVKYSLGRFGFSVQLKIWESKNVGGHPRAGLDIEDKFGDIVGWRKGVEWLIYNNLTFNINAPIGHLPWDWGGGRKIDGIGARLGGWFRVFSRAKTCNL